MLLHFLCFRFETMCSSFIMFFVFLFVCSLFAILVIAPSDFMNDSLQFGLKTYQNRTERCIGWLIED